MLVLDDYHIIEVDEILRAIAFLLDHMPPGMHLALATRADPPLPLAQLRARGAMTELRAQDLRFSPDEAAAFLNQQLGLELPERDVAALETRTEGWVAELQLVALALQDTLSTQGRDAISSFIQTFAGDDRFIADYLVEEVLQRQPQVVQAFLQHTSLLDRLCEPLCDAVLGIPGPGAGDTPEAAQGTVGKTWSLLWLVALIGLSAAGVGLLFGQDWWPTLALGAAVVSLVAIVPWVRVVPPGAWAGALLDLAIVVALASPWADRVVQAVA